MPTPREATLTSLLCPDAFISPLEIDAAVERALHAGVEHRDHVRVMHARQRLRLGDDLSAHGRRRHQQLDRDLAIERRIVRFPDHAEAAVADDAQEQIAPEGAMAVRQGVDGGRAGDVDRRRQKIAVVVPHCVWTLPAGPELAQTALARRRIVSIV